MAKPNTRKKSTAHNRARKQVAGQLLTDLVARKVASWQQAEATRLLSGKSASTNTYIIETKRGYRVGLISVTESGDDWQVTNISNIDDGYFYNKSRALLYAILMHSGRKAMAKQVRDADRKIVKYTTDIEFYRHSIKSASKKKDYARAESIWYRLDDSVYRLKEAREQLEKTVFSAKYIKLWDEQV
jgi:hypothetical protein